MDRKTSSIITDISELEKETSNLKGVQPFGYDTSELVMATNNNTYDETITLAAGARHDFSIYCWSDDDVYPFNIHQGYSQILFQIWVNDMSTPYYGEVSGIGVFTPVATNSPFAPGNDMLTIEVINSSAAPITIFIKAYAITTLTNPVVQI